MENQHNIPSMNASQDYTQGDMSASGSNWMNKMGSLIPNSFNSAASQVKNMSTTQKVAGGAILAAGAWYLANRSTVNHKIQEVIASRTKSTDNSTTKAKKSK